MKQNGCGHNPPVGLGEWLWLQDEENVKGLMALRDREGVKKHM